MTESVGWVLDAEPGCRVCDAEVLARGLCRACYRWDRRHKRPRTPEELRALNYRRLVYWHERAIVRRVLRHESQA